MRLRHPVLLVIALTLTLAESVRAADQAPRMIPAPERAQDEGQGPFERLIIRGATLIDGSGAPPIGPVDIVVEGNRIAEVKSVGYPGLEINPDNRPGDATFEIDAHGAYVMPGIVDMHTHTGGPNKAPRAEYTYKLWLAHGVTTVRGVPSGTMEFSLAEKRRSAANEIVAPRIYSYHTIGSGERFKAERITGAKKARDWVRYAAKQGADGVKLFSHPRHITAAVIDEARQQGLGTTAHLAQMSVAQVNALDAARFGLGTVTHFYGLFEAMYEAHDVQPWPTDMNYNNEQHRFGQVARQADLVAPGSEKWRALQDELLELGLNLDPTFNIYSASRDVMRARNADWHDTYTLPTQWDFYTPNRVSHGAYWFDWTTEDEVAWRRFYQVWMQFVNEYKNRGGRVTVGSDSGFIYQLYGFGTILEMEMLQEAGFHPLEVIRSATYNGALTLVEPAGEEVEFGLVRPGLLADLVVVDENPIQNLKVLYGTGAVRLNDNTGQPERVGGVRLTIKDGIVYDARELLEDVAVMVREAKGDGGLNRY